jgi:ElaA protein
MRIGRVVTAREARGAGLAKRLVAAALEVDPSAPTVLDAQSHLVGFYGALGFTPVGAEYIDEDGIPHVPMRRPAASGAARQS